MEFKILTKRLRQFGGFRLICEYAKIGALWIGVEAFLRCLIKRISFKAIYPVVLKKVEPFLVERYSPLMKSRYEELKRKNKEHTRSNIIWFCWLQGFDNAPELVHICYNSLKKHLPERKIEVIDSINWKQYVDLPEYVLKKWGKRQIPPANFSDLLRLQLLIKYGGTWVDSTLLCTGFSSEDTQKQKLFLDCDLFVFRYTLPGDTVGIRISNWFISACTNNEVLIVVRDLLYAYWKDFDCILDYCMFHLFFNMVANAFPFCIESMLYGSSQKSIALMKHCNEIFNQEKWDKLVSKVAFHKLSYRVQKETISNKCNYYSHIEREYGTTQMGCRSGE